MKNILLTLLFIQASLSTTLGQESIQVDFANYLFAGFDASTCTYTIDGIGMQLSKTFHFPFTQNCAPPQDQDHIFAAKFDRCDIPLSTTPSTLLVSTLGGCVDFYIRVNYIDGSFEEASNFIYIDEFAKEVQSITVTEIECGLVLIYNGQPDPGLGAATITFTKIDDLPFLITPTNEAKNQKIDTLIFDWLVNDQNAEYLFQIDTTDKFLNPFFQDIAKGGRDTVYGLEYNRDYYWRVKKQITYCPSAWLDTFKFTTIIRLDIFQNILEAQTPQDQILFKDSLLSIFMNEKEYNVAADATLTMLIKRNRGVLTIRGDNGVVENGSLIDSTGLEGFKLGKYESPHKYLKDKVVYIDYKHDPNLTQPDLTIKINIRPTPVIFVHNIFQTASGTWGPIKSALNSNGWGLYIDEMNYSNDISFSDANISSELQLRIDGLISYIRAGNDFVNKVSLAGHGTGGLIIRNYLNSNSEEKNVSRLITLNTPHLGTPMANWILDSEPGLYYWLSREALKYSGAIDNNGGFPSLHNGGLASIRTDSPEIFSLNSSTISIPSHSIASNTSVLCQIELAKVLNEALTGNILEQLIGKKLSVIIEIIEGTKELICEENSLQNQQFCVINDIIIEDDNDGFVGVISQLGGLDLSNTTIHANNTFEYLHFNNPNRSEIVEELKTLLEEDSEGVLFSQDGFNPFSIGTTSSLSNTTGSSSSDTLVEISILNIQNNDTICHLNPVVSVEGNDLTTRLMVIYFYENDSIKVDTIHSSSNNFIIPIFPNYHGNVNIGIVGTDGYGHYDFDTLSIFIKNQMSVEPNITVFSNTDKICSGEEVVFNASVLNEGSLPVYQWYVNNSPIGVNGPNFSISSLADGAEIYCSLTSSLGCVSPEAVISNSIIVSVIPTVLPTIDVVASKLDICVGEEVIFSASTLNEGSSPIYQWYLNGTPVGNNTSTFFSSSISDGSEAYCQLTSNAECTTSSVVTSAPITISVSQAGEPSLEISASSMSICEGGEVEFNAFPGNGGPSPSYQWFVSGVPVGINSSTFSTSSLSDGAQVYCHMTSSSDCADPLEVTSSTITLSVIANSVPEVEITASATSICLGDEVSFIANTTNGGSTPFYQWFIDGLPVGANSSTLSYNLLADEALVTCSLTSSEECANPLEVISNAISIEVTTLDIPDLATNQDTIFASNYNTEQFNFEWYLDGNLISNEPFIICQNSGLYELFLTLNDCTVSNNLDVQTCTVGTNDLGSLNSIFIYPNPASKSVTLEGKKVIGREFVIKLSNVFGQILREHIISSSGSWFSVELEISNIPSGNYIIQIVSEHDIRAFKLIKE